MTSRRILKTLAVVLALGALALAQAIPAGTHLTVRLGRELSSGTATTGQVWDGTLAKDAVVNGKTVAAAGTPVKGKVTHAKSSGRLQHPGELTLRLTSVGDQPVSTSAVARKAKSHTKSNVTKIGGGTAAGALIGGIAGGGKGAGIGALAGGAAGTGVAAYTGKQEVVLPAESVVSFTVTGAGSTASRRRH